MKLAAKVRLNPGAEQHRSLLHTMETANACANWLRHEAWGRKVFAQFRLRTAGGRQRIPYSAGKRQEQQLGSQQGESELILHRGKWFLAATCNIDHPTPAAIDDFLGVDLGAVQIAADSDGQEFSGSMVNNVRYRHRKLRQNLQAIQSKSAKRHLKNHAGKEFRFAQNINHTTAKEIVEKAKRTRRGIAIEKLTGIRDVECSPCGHIEKANRPSQSKFRCQSCNYAANADFNAAQNLRSRAKDNRPIAARVRAASRLH